MKWTHIINFFVLVIIGGGYSIKADALEDKVANAADSMNIYEYRIIKENTLSKGFNTNRLFADDLYGKKLIMEAIKDGLLNVQTKINLNSYIKYFKSINDSRVPMNYFFDTLNEYPEIFYPNLTVKASYSYNESGNEITSYDLLVTYQYDKNTINNMKADFNEKIKDIQNNYLVNTKSYLEKEYVIHDYIIKNCRYDYTNIKNLPTIDHTSYGSLINGIAVCDGYSKGAKALFDLCGIESGIVESEVMNHAWNYVNINGQYYNLDITWDDKGIEDNIDYSYFNISNYYMGIGGNPHRWDISKYPDCISNEFNFLRDNDFYIRNDDKLYMVRTLNGVKKSYIRDLDGSNFKEKLLEDINNDGRVDINDLAIMANSYNFIRGQAGFNSIYDLNADGIIDIYDLTKVSYKMTF